MPRADRQQPTPPAAASQGDAGIPVSKPRTTKSKAKPPAETTRPNGKSTRGRQSTYSPVYAAQAAVLMRDHGFTEAELAKALLVTVPTLAKWKAEHPELLSAINKGRDMFDSTRVRAALRSRALGYEYEEREEGITAGLHGGPYEKTFKKKMAPDVTACIFWLVNRQPDDWKHVARTIIQGDPKNPVKHEYELNLKQLPEKELAELENIIGRARAEQQADKAGRHGNA